MENAVKGVAKGFWSQVFENAAKIKVIIYLTEVPF
jgi:hypothetical protein